MSGLNGQNQKHSRQQGGFQNPDSGGRFLEAALEHPPILSKPWPWEPTALPYQTAHFKPLAAWVCAPAIQTIARLELQRRNLILGQGSW